MIFTPTARSNQARYRRRRSLIAVGYGLSGLLGLLTFLFVLTQPHDSWLVFQILIGAFLCSVIGTFVLDMHLARCLQCGARFQSPFLTDPRAQWWDWRNMKRYKP